MTDLDKLTQAAQAVVDRWDRFDDTKFSDRIEDLRKALAEPQPLRETTYTGDLILEILRKGLIGHKVAGIWHKPNIGSIQERYSIYLENGVELTISPIEINQKP